MILVGFGTDDEFEGVAERIRSQSRPLIDATMPLPYTAVQTLFDEANPWSPLLRGLTVLDSRDGGT